MSGFKWVFFQFKSKSCSRHKQNSLDENIRLAFSSLSHLKKEKKKETRPICNFICWCVTCKAKQRLNNTILRNGNDKVGRLTSHKILNVRPYLYWILFIFIKAIFSLGLPCVNNKTWLLHAVSGREKNTCTMANTDTSTRFASLQMK